MGRVDRVERSTGIVWWRVLGPLQVRTGEAWAGVRAPKWRTLAAALLAEPGEVVSTERLIGELWGDEPPSSARQLVSGYVLQLRRLIGDPGGQVLVTEPPGYRLAIARDEVDAGRFEELAARGRRALADDHAGLAAGLSAEALITRSLWVMCIGKWGVWTRAVLPIDDSLGMPEEETITGLCDLVASLIRPPRCHDNEKAMIALRRPGPAEISEADVHIFRLILQAADGRETAPWTFHVVGPEGIRQVTENETSQDTNTVMAR
jgi:Transcriptional regulatory protein, C terminal